MKASRGAPFTLIDAFKLIFRYRGMIIMGTIISSLLAITAANLIPKRYKCLFVMTISAKYFQNPLIRDIIPEISDAGEMRSQREVLIRQSLSREFLDSLGHKYGIYHPAPGAQKIPRVILQALGALKAFSEKWGLTQPQKQEVGNDSARRKLLESIQIFNLNNTTFQVSLSGSDPGAILNATEDIYAQIARTLLETRTRNLTTLRNAIRKRQESLAFNMESAPDPRATLRPQLLREELGDVRNQLRALGAQYTEEHPLITELRERELVLVRWLDGSSLVNPGQASEEENTFSSEKTAVSGREIYGDLTKKLDYLNIALESDKVLQDDFISILVSPAYPKEPLWPNKALFALWGFSGGLAGSFFLAAIRNYFEKSALHAQGLAETLGLPFLGALPLVPGKSLSR